MTAGVIRRSRAHRKRPWVADVAVGGPVSPGTTNLISWWSLDEASGTRADSHGSNDLTDNNTVTQGTGKVGNAADFTAANQESLSIASNSTLQMGGTDFTLAMWINLESKSTTGNWFYTKRNATSGIELEAQVIYSTTNSALRFSWWDNSTTLYLVDAGDLNLSQWYFVVAWYDGTANKIYLQVDDGTPTELATSGSITSADGPVYIGKLAVGADNATHDGLIDEIAFYKRVLTSAERTWLYNSGSGRAYTDL